MFKKLRKFEILTLISTNLEIGSLFGTVKGIFARMNPDDGNITEFVSYVIYDEIG